jgi:hypothetical protein
MKTHYAMVERGNESTPWDEWGSTLCGLEYTESELSNDISKVTCKKCIKAYPKFKKIMDELSAKEYFPFIK